MVAGIAVMLTIPTAMAEVRSCHGGAVFTRKAVGTRPAAPSPLTAPLPRPQIAKHLETLYEPRLQLLVVRILWMVRRRRLSPRIYPCAAPLGGAGGGCCAPRAARRTTRLWWGLVTP